MGAYSAIVKVQETDVWAEDEYGKTIDEGEAGVDDASVIQAALNHLGSKGGSLYIGGGDYTINTKITIPSHAGKSIIIQGEGMRKTKLQWDISVPGDFILDAYADTGEWKICFIRDLQLWGGTSGNETGKAIKIGRLSTSESSWYVFENVRFAYCIDAAIEAYKVQNSFWYNCAAENNTGYDLKTLSDGCHFQLYGGNFPKIQIKNALLKAWGVTFKHIENQKSVDYSFLLDGCTFDPVPTGYGSHVVLGTSTSGERVDNFRITNCSFIGKPESVSDYFINVVQANNGFISNNHYFTGTGEPTVYIYLGANSKFITVELPRGTDLSKVSDSGTANIVRYIDFKPFNKYVNIFTDTGGYSVPNPGTNWVNIHGKFRRRVNFQGQQGGRLRARILVSAVGNEAGTKGLRIYDETNSQELCKYEWSGTGNQFQGVGDWTDLPANLGDIDIMPQVYASSATEDITIYAIAMEIESK